MTIPHFYTLLLHATAATLAVLFLALLGLRVLNRALPRLRLPSVGDEASRMPRAVRRVEGPLDDDETPLRGETWRLEKLLFSRDRDVRVAAAQALGRQRSPEAAAALIEGLRREALPETWLLDPLGRPWAADVIVSALHDPSLLSIRAQLADAAGIAGALAAVHPLRAMLRTGRAHERVRAARSLRRLGDTAAAPMLITALTDGEWEVRAEAALALGGLGDPTAVPALERALHDDSWWVQANAATAIGQLGRRGRRALNRLLTSTDATTRERAREVICIAPVGARPPERELVAA